MSVGVSLEDPVFVSVPASSMERMRQFYRTVLAPARYREVVKVENGIMMIGYAAMSERRDKPDDPPDLWLRPVPDGQTISPIYISLPVYNCRNVTKEINEFYTAAIQQGAKEKHVPKFRHITEDKECYYNATVIDPEGNELSLIDGLKYEWYKETPEGRDA
ncbi:hypothetical protein PISL3812_01449 [Talaromyces islandicus]|uniref:VOC domain-containing protein n=1 Tax=Talaromyces islandicus TaxID=28573 RepID=A0A0U1LPL2_TALIS|nr:hypothetical protein PISL3812_01449 [Talaromyces islandicus]